MSSNSTDKREIRRFGLIALIFFGSLCAVGILTKKAVPTYLFGCLGILGLGFILIPFTLRPVYSGWMKVSHLLGRILTTLILTMAYYMVITPSAFIKRFLGGRPLPIRPDKEAKSYWVPRTEPIQPKERFMKRF